MMNQDLTDLQLELKTFTRQFAEAEMGPAVDKCVAMSGARQAHPENLLNSIMQIGLHSISVPEQQGGVGADRLTECIVAEELGRVDLGIASLLEQTWQATRLLGALPPTTSIEYLSGISGSDPYLMALVHDSETVTVEKVDDSFSLNGRLLAVVGAEFARYLLISSPERLLVIVPLPSIGATLTPTSYIGQTLSGRMNIEFDDCLIPAANVHSTPIGQLNTTVLAGAAAMVGTAQVAFDLALDYARVRRQGGDLLIKHQALGNMLASMSAHLDAARSLVWRSARDMGDSSEPDSRLQMTSRLIASEVALEVVTRAIEVFGGYGIMRDLPLGRYLGDLVVAINSNTSMTSQLDDIRHDLARGL
jgi:alkylation response protein AidB-like acyl-CoA dehydrogenase